MYLQDASRALVLGLDGRISRGGPILVLGAEDTVILLFGPLFEDRLGPAHCASLLLFEKRCVEY